MMMMMMMVMVMMMMLKMIMMMMTTGTMLPGPPDLTCFVLLAHVKKFHQKIILITLMSVLTILFTRNWRS